MVENLEINPETIDSDDLNKFHGDVIVVYDYECPLCRNYCAHVRINKAVGKLQLVDARTPSPLMDAITAQGLDIDEGMVVKMGDILYYGSDAIHVLSLLSSRSGWFNKLCYWSFKSRMLSHILYPLCKAIRNLVLRICKISRINNLQI